MESESTVRAGERLLPEWAARFTDNALVGWIVVVGLTVVGFLLFLPGSGGAPAWPASLFLAIGLFGTVAYGSKVFPFFRRLERRLPGDEEHWQRLESKLIASFEQLGAGDLVRSGEHTAKPAGRGCRGSRPRRATR